MTVYVDSIRKVAVPTCRRNLCCHLMADTEEELHSFAKRLRLKREWAHRSILLHYDITETKRTQAIALGAVVIDRKKIHQLVCEKHANERGEKGG